MDPYQQQQLAQRMLYLGLNPADPMHRARFVQQVAQQPMYAVNGTGPPVNITRGWVITEARGIFVGNLNYKANEEAISNRFQDAGTIVGIDLQRDHQTKKSKGICTIHFDSAKSAQRAIAMFNNTYFMEKRLLVREDREFTAVNVPSAGPAAAPSQPAARNGAPPLIVSSTPTQSHCIAKRQP